MCVSGAVRQCQILTNQDTSNETQAKNAACSSICGQIEKNEMEKTDFTDARHVAFPYTITWLTAVQFSRARKSHIITNNCCSCAPQPCNERCIRLYKLCGCVFVRERMSGRSALQVRCL